MSTKKPVNCKKQYWKLKNVYCKDDVFTESCKKIKYDASSMTIDELLYKVNELIKRKAAFNECHKRRQEYTDSCYGGVIDEGHLKQMKLLDKAQAICDSEIKAVRSVIIVKEKQMKEIIGKFNKLV